MMGLKKKMVVGVVAGALMVVLTAGAALALSQIECASFEQNPLTPQCYGTEQEDAIEGRRSGCHGHHLRQWQQRPRGR